MLGQNMSVVDLLGMCVCVQEKCEDKGRMIRVFNEPELMISILLKKDVMKEHIVDGDKGIDRLLISRLMMDCVIVFRSSIKTVE